MIGLVLVVLVCIAALVAGAYLKISTRRKRAGALAALAQRIGFTFTESDVDHLVEMPFDVFSRGRRRGVEMVVSGTHNGVPLRMFDYWYVVDSGRNEVTYRFTCAIATIAAACPRLQLGHETFMTRLGDDVGLHDVELEYEDFNRRFRVRCRDRKFAFALLDGEMMQWLLAADAFESVEVDGPWVLIVRHRQAPPDWLDLGTWLDQFVRHVPTVVFSTYPRR